TPPAARNRRSAPRPVCHLPVQSRRTFSCRHERSGGPRLRPPGTRARERKWTLFLQARARFLWRSLRYLTGSFPNQPNFTSLSFVARTSLLQASSLPEECHESREISMSTIFLLLPTMLLPASGSFGDTPSDADRAAIKQAALDYIEGWYEGNAERMERSLHPELAKRIVRADPKSGLSRLDQMSAMTLVQGTRAGYGKKIPKDKQQKDVTILDTYGN